MSKAVMLSIRPKWVEKIANGEKTIELRKTRPKMNTPFKCYIYCTLQGCNEFFRVDLGRDVAKWNRGKWADRKGKVIGEFVCDYILQRCEMANADIAEQQSCVRREDIYFKYSEEGKHYIYGWHISNLKIYDAPKKLGEFWRDCNVCGDGDETDCNTDGRLYLRRPPQSWCYVEVMKDAWNRRAEDG